MSISLGVDPDRNLVYEGNFGDARPIWPSPVITPAALTHASSVDDTRADHPQGIKYCKLVFREDFFDPISRIRRGRFYEAGDQQPHNWSVHPHPAMVEGVSPSFDGRYSKSLHTYFRASIAAQLRQIAENQPLIVLGFGESSTHWTIVSIESTITGEDLVTLRSSRSFGILPTVDWSRVPVEHESEVNSALQRLIDENNRATPISVIDRARDAASQILLAHYRPTSNRAKDLAALANQLAEEQQIVSASAARLIARLHARAKPTERSKRSLPSIREQDAELAILCVGTILRELGWARWA